MKTQFTSNQTGISEQNLSKHFGETENIKVLNLWNISLLSSGSGTYNIEATFNIDNKEHIIKIKTHDMQLVDAWKSGTNNMFEDGDDGFDNWDEVAESMLFAINDDSLPLSQ